MTDSTPRRRTAATTATLATFIAACGPHGATPPAPQPVAGPLPGDNYAVVYQGADAIRRQDTRTGFDGPVAAGVDSVVLTAPSPDGRQVVVAYRHGDSSRAVLIQADSSSFAELHAGPAGTVYTARWSEDGTGVGLGFRQPDGSGGIRLFGHGAVRDIGCRAAFGFDAWRSASQVIVHDTSTAYAVRTSDCATLSAFPRAGKSDMTYARNGARTAWYRTHTVEYGNTHRSETIPELWISSYDGADAKIIADYRSRPRDAAWAPDASRIAYEVASRRWANTSHVVIYAVATATYTYKAHEMPLGVPSDFGVCWSPDGRRIAHDRVYARRSAVQDYATRQVVVREGDQERVIFEEILDRPAAQVEAHRPPPCRWLGDRYVMVSAHRGWRVVDADGGPTYEVPSAESVLTAYVFPRGPGS